MAPNERADRPDTGGAAPEPTDLLTELATDHRAIGTLLGRLGTAAPGTARRKELLDTLTIELVRHTVAEEEHLYPAVRKHLAGGGGLADRKLADHQHIEELLRDLEPRAADDARFDGLVDELTAAVTRHIGDEERTLFPLLREGVHPFVLESLGRKAREAKKTAPTHPHPHAPSAPPALGLLAPGIGLVDRVRDYLTGRH
ncbi:hemerythrin domain-containing protein [Streptomyces sp. RS10V-4]|uniref:hemerythrin domain-containing protein n=1 Tax=Streptomyces rhizoryzae TaxID=2932493 RepID=UPI00200347E3|nr:hemerythrin domain-containing protein [Streptomyces rhizoryzae]MCK7625292.1 hemerythrin domain-containing protein [Streptomyces rhizoryzae]